MQFKAKTKHSTVSFSSPPTKQESYVCFPYVSVPIVWRFSVLGLGFNVCLEEPSAKN